MEPLGDLLARVAAAQASEDAARIEGALGALHRELREGLPEDPLLAASCLAVVQDEDLRSLLEPIAAQARPLSARAKAVVTDGAGKGQVVELLVELSPGGRGVWTVQPCSDEVRLSIQLAVAAALGGEAGRFGLRWQLSGPYAGQRIRGPSLGLAAAVATRAAREERIVPASWAFTGSVELDGRLVSVSGLPAKVRAAREAELAVLALPEADRKELGRARGLELVGAPHLEALLARLFEPAQRGRRAWPILPALLLLVPAILGWLGGTDAVEVALRPALVRALHGELEAENTVLLGIPPEADRRALRARYPEILFRLEQAGARAVVLDVLLLTETEHDAALAQAISAVDFPVIAPVRIEDGVRRPPGALGEALDLGVGEFEQDLLFGKVRQAPARMETDEELFWHLAVLGLAGHQRARPELHGSELAVGVTRNPLREGRVLLPPVQRSPRLDWDRPETWELARDRVVLVGIIEGRADTFRSTLGPRYGLELHAALVEALARQSALRVADPTLDALVALLTALGTAALAAFLPGRLRLSALLVGVVGLAVLVGVAAAGTLPALVPTVLATLAGFWAGPRLRRD
jgi:CHASE2 domain-containing sensor protein